MSLSTPLRRTTLPLPSIPKTQLRHANLLRRPKRPYTFTQLVTLSDGSTYTQRTTSPQPVYKSTKDTRNTPLWNPSSLKLLNMETDEAGKLRAFREKFGRGWDAGRLRERDEEAEKGEVEGEGEEEDNLLDLISGFGEEEREREREGRKVRVKVVNEEKQKADELKRLTRQRNEERRKQGFL